MALTCVCKNVGLFKLFWMVQVAEGIVASYLFLMPCARCNLAAYSTWLVKTHPKLSRLVPNLVKQETVVAS